MSSTVQNDGQKKRPSHHLNDSATSFQNTGSSAWAPTWAELASVSFPLSWYTTDSANSSHVRQVKLVKPDWGAENLKLREEMDSKSEFLIATWLGHAGAMVEFPPLSIQGIEEKESCFVLFDPIFSFRAGPTQYTGTARLQESPCQVADLPGCNAVFISHNHYDHLDLPTVLAIMAKYPDTKWFVPLGNKAWFLASGAKEENVVELDWWETWDWHFGTDEDSKTNDQSSWFKISCVPAQHTSGRTGVDQASTLWSGWVVERFVSEKDKDSTKPKTIRKGSVYHAGDTGYRRIANSEDICPAFKEIGEKFDSLDVSFIPIWRGGSLGFMSYAGVRLLHQHMPSALHCSPEDAVAIHKDVRSKNTIAVHFGTFVGSEAESREAVLEFYQACDEAKVIDLDNEDFAENGRAGTLNIGGSFIVDL